VKIALNIDVVGARRGGAEKYAGTLARWLIAAGHEVHVYASEVESGELPPGTPIHRIHTGTWPGFGWMRAWQFGRESEKALAAEDFDLIIGLVKTWYQHAYVAVGGAHPASLESSSRRFRSPLLRGCWWLTKWLSPKQWVFRFIERLQFGSYHEPHVIAPACLVADHFRRHYGIPGRRLSVVPNGLDDTRRSSDAGPLRQAFRGRHGLAQDDAAVLFVARNYELKGLTPLLEAFAPVARRHDESRLFVCGSLSDGAYRRQVRRLGVEKQVVFQGFVDDIEACFAGCDVFAFPTFYDPCSLVVFEAMRAGLATITTRQNGAGELIDEGKSGYVIESPWAIPAMTDRLERLVADPALRRRIGATAREQAREFGLADRAEEMLTALARAAADPMASPKRRIAA
jgi:UDP-glucose:(heptosyl)LPS alpha-1,3-glucosyltransferase